MTAILPSDTTHPPPTPRGAWPARLVATGLVLVFLLLAGRAFHRWATYPQVPDVASADLDSAISFIGTDDFNRMGNGHRLEYALAVVDRLGQASFADLAKLMFRRDENRARIASNIRGIEGHDQVGSRMFALFLEKYYDQSPAERQGALLIIAAAQQGQILRNPEAFGLPTADQFKQDFGRFVSRQPPRIQAMCGQFLIDLKQQRDSMGLRDPF
jgi:hypothetical protein